MKNLYLFLLIIANFSTNAQIINFPDPQLKAKLVSANQWNFIAQDLNGNMTAIDLNNDGEIQVSEALNIAHLTFNQTQISDFTGIQSFANLEFFTAQGNSHIDELDVSNMVKLKNLSLNNNTLDNINIQGCSQLEYLSLINNAGFITNLNFLQSTSLKRLLIGQNDHMASANLSNVPSLEELTVSDSSVYPNPAFTSLDLSGNPNLKKIAIDKNNLTALTLGTLNYLEEFTLEKTQLVSVNLSAASLLTYLYLNNNLLLSSANIQNCNNLDNLLLVKSPQLTSINLQNKTNLTSFSCSETGITSLDFSDTPGIINLSIGGNALSSVDLSPVTALSSLNFNESITELDLSHNALLQGLSVQSPTLVNLNIKNGGSIQNFSPAPAAYLPQLTYVCCDTNKVQEVSGKLITQGLNNVVVNSYCSFAPGGTLYTVEGNVKYDADSNGCDINDINKGFQQFNIVTGSTTGSMIANNSGNYAIAVQAGAHTLTPVIENPAYFNISPTSVTVDFPAQTSPQIQNFCLTANGNHNDLEVVIIPLTAAAPGFNAQYKIVYKNKGTTTQSGTIEYHFDDGLMNYLNATLAPSSQTTGVLNWTFTNLLPFETKEITVTFTLNTPVQTPALNGGDILHYTAEILGANDETPSDNSFALHQTVVNSFDPNDKTCLEGSSIAQTQIGDYVHYLIRFENTGSANAQNIVVKDEIDSSRFDLSTLIPLHASHSFITGITNGNTIEFIFENIQLPFDDSTNDGYIAFKIKTKSTLMPGDSFSNTARIYFDYNAPIITNTYTTNVRSTLAVSEVKKDTSNIRIYPNPVQDFLHIESPNEILKAEIYDASGKIMFSAGIKGNVINVTNLSGGNYLIKLFARDTVTVQKFIKN